MHKRFNDIWGRAAVLRGLLAVFIVGASACGDAEGSSAPADVGGPANDSGPSDVEGGDSNADASPDVGPADGATADVEPADDARTGDPDGTDAVDPADASDGALADADDGANDDTARPTDTSVADTQNDDAPGDAIADAGTSVDDGLPFGGRPSLAEVLAYLSSDTEARVRLIANARGWPLAIEGGRLIVCLDPALTHIAGDFDGWVGTPLSSASGFRWISLGDLAGGQRYKFTDRTRFVADPWSRALIWDEFGDMSLTIPSEAHVERYFGLGNAEIAPRNLYVWVPAEPVTHVLYAHDGQNLFGPGSAFGSWRMDEAAPAGMLIVGIFNTSARFAEYTPVQDQVGGADVGGEAEAYLTFVRDTVRPLVRRIYSEPGPVGILGSSLGGVVSLYAAVSQPDDWDFAASLSGALSWGSRATRNPTLHAYAAELAASDAVLYLDSGGGGSGCVDSDGDGVEDDDPTEADDYCVTVQLRDQLVAAGRTFSADLFHWWEPGAAHNEAAWSTRVIRPLTVFAALE